MSGLIDLNHAAETEDDEGASDGVASLDRSSSQLKTAPFCASPSSVCMELWHACAGPLISLPKKGSRVVYFPQGHVEHSPEERRPSAAYNLPQPHVFCRVADVGLHADAANDEVYAQVSLSPDRMIEQKYREESDYEDSEAMEEKSTMTPHMFCKTLTASDTSTHGGFSVPRRAAEDCFPPLDYNQQRPSQELVAKDLHGMEWKFRHIYRGQPRRHLLTTGWSGFVNKKKLVSGDAVLFLRGGNGDLRLGIRRASPAKTRPTLFPPNGQPLNASSFSAVANAISTQSTFSICYNPRARSSEIIVPYRKFSKSVAQHYAPGMRFRIRPGTEDTSERSGVIVGVGEADPVGWPGSKWKSLLVRWEHMELNRLKRVSPWEIELMSSLAEPNHSFVLTGLKRSRPTSNADLPLLPRVLSDVEEPMRFQKVLQGQEIFRFRTPFSSGRIESSTNGAHPMIPLQGRTALLLGESFQFPKVLQGQETSVKDDDDVIVLDGAKLTSHGFSRVAPPWLDGYQIMVPRVDPCSNDGSCRLFGFPLTNRAVAQENNGPTKEGLLLDMAL